MWGHFLALPSDFGLGQQDVNPHLSKEDSSNDEIMTKGVSLTMHFILLHLRVGESSGNTMLWRQTCLVHAKGPFPVSMMTGVLRSNDCTSFGMTFVVTMSFVKPESSEVSKWNSPW